MKILSFDIEEWVLRGKDDPQRDLKIKTYNEILDKILETLDERKMKATFFCLGKMGSDYPEIVRKISDLGHEIGCHSNAHGWVNKSTREEFLKDTREAIDSLEQCIGKKILSYRAPAFSISESSKWAFEILTDCGIENDCSIFPTSRDFGGYPNFPGKDKPCQIDLGNGKSINEFPINLVNLPIVNKTVAYSGGGYFRFFPLWYAKSRMKKDDYVMCYFHIADLAHFKNKFPTRQGYEAYFKEPGTLLNRTKRYIKGNIGKGALPSLINLINSFDFISVEQATQKPLSITGIKV